MRKGYYIVPVVIAGLYIHWSIGEAIAASLIYIWYVILAVVMISNVLGIIYAIRRLITEWQISVSQAQIAIAESQKANRDIREFGDKVFHFGVSDVETTHALHLEASPYSNGRYVAPTNQQMAIFNMVSQTHNEQTNNNYYDNEPIQDGVPLLESGDAWIDDIVINAPHIHLAGATGSGKTTFARLLIDKLIQAENGSDFWLIDPKYKVSNPIWPIDPFVKNIKMAVSGLMKLVDALDIRNNDADYHPDKDTNQIIIIDDWDWIFEHHNREAVSALRMLLKIGRSNNFRVLLIGQSTLSGDTGLSRSDYNNMVSVALKHEAYQLLKMLPLTLNEKRPYREELATMEQNGQRYALIVPYSGLPIVRGIPDLSHYLTPHDKPVLQAPLTMDLTTNDKELTMIEALKDGMNISNAAVILTGKERKKINGTDTKKVVQIAQKYGIDC